MRIKTDILIIGGGSAGFGAAYRALENGKNVVLAEQYGILGGTSTIGGVSNWEPGVSGNGVHYRLAKKLLDSGKGFVGRTVSFCKAGQPYAVSDRSADGYESTLKRFGVSENEQRRFQFEPLAMAESMKELLTEKGGDRLTLLMNMRFTSLSVKNGRITSIFLDSPQKAYEVIPDIVIDCTGSIIVARAAGCMYAVGDDTTNNQTTRLERINGLSKCFILERCEKGLEPTCGIDAVKREYPETAGIVSCFYVCPDRSGKYLPSGNDSLTALVGSDARISVNMLPTLPGRTAFDLSPDELEKRCEARIFAYRERLAADCGLSDWKITKISPLTGIREDYRLIGKYILRNEDQANGFAKIPGKDRIVAYADHPADIHGSGGCLKPTGVYGIPYDCMLTREIGNLIVSCRGASFSHIAASSARLSRTMMALGEAAGNAAAICVSENVLPDDLTADAVRTLMPRDPG